MKTERERDAKEFRAQGQQQAQQIRAKADKERTIIIAEAEKQAQITRGQGDETAIKIWNDAAGTDPEFYAFYRSLEAYKTSLGDGEARTCSVTGFRVLQLFRKVDENGKIETYESRTRI